MAKEEVIYFFSFFLIYPFIYYWYSCLLLILEFGCIMLSKHKKILFFSMIMFLFMMTQVFFISENRLNDTKPNSFLKIISVQGLTYDDASIVNYDVVKHSDNNFTVVFIDQIASNKKLGIISTTSNFLWETTLQYLKEETTDYSFVGKPSLTYLQNSLYIAYPFKGASTQGIELIIKDLDTGVSSNVTIFQDSDDNFNNPILMNNATNNGLILVWQNDASGHHELFLTKSNTTILDWGEQIKVSAFNETNNKDCYFIMDSLNDLHFTWAYGESDHEKILYRTVYANSTLAPIENVTDGSNRCREPVAIIDNYNYVNLFWTNYSVANPDLQMGTININTARRLLSGGPWMDYIEVAPFIPFERPPSGESDGFTPAVALDQQNRLWLAYAIREEYANHMGIDIRHREDNNWMPGGMLSLLNNGALDPLLIVDDFDNLHCFWMDFRHSTFEIYHRIKFSTDTWSDEVLVTFTGKYFRYLWQVILVVLGVFLIMGVPFVVVNILRRKRAEKLIKSKVGDLQ
ncbi:MAG: hypothetical protein ACTSO7_14100 [Candidatus Heimdallarchaeota archaeon]